MRESKGKRPKVKKPVCSGCPDYLTYMGRGIQPVPGVTLKLGQRFCNFKGKSRQFKETDPKLYVPGWCPRWKTPCELRIYSFKSSQDWMLHEMLCNSLEQDISPDAHRYYLHHELTTDLTPSEFAHRCNEPSGSLIHVVIHLHEVVEIDDGLAPTCFYKTSSGYQVAAGFRTDVAKLNCRENDE